MSRFENLVHRLTDEVGEIHVYEDRRFRYLTFGNEVEQSCQALNDPDRLEHVHTQAMMLGLLFNPEPCRAILLGMGGGSLIRALRKVLPDAELVGVEQRAAVIDVARAWFGLPTDRGFHAVCAEAQAFLGSDRQQADLIMSDLYLSDAVDPRQATIEYLQTIRRRLSPGGILTVNHWASDYIGTREALYSLEAVFDGQLVNVHVQGGNIITLAFNGGLPQLARAPLFDRALSLGLRLKIPLKRHALNLWRQNAEVLGVGRFRRRS